MSNYRIVLVGENNLTRSIMGEAILKGILQEKNITNVEVISRGLVVLFSEPIPPKLAGILRKHGRMDISNRSTPLEQEDLDHADLVLTMQHSEVNAIKESFDVQTTCMCISTFIDMEEEIIDIYEDTTESYQDCYDAVEQAMEATAERIIMELLQ